MSERTVELPLDKEGAETVKDELVDLRESRVYQLVQARIEGLLQQCLGKLEREQDVMSLKGLQGQAQAYRRALGMVSEILREIENTNYAKRMEVHSGN